MTIPELLAPAGDKERLKVALAYGADAVYLGGKNFGLRAFSDNFSADDLAWACQYAHSLGRKVYVTVNMFPHNSDLTGLPDYLGLLAEVKADAILVADPGIFSLAKDQIPQIPIHVSTQANTTNWRSALFWQELGARRIVLARELSLTETIEIRRKVSVELECFVHGAMCISYSGRCLLSSYMAERSANRGECAQPCRWQYALVEEKRPGQYFPIEEDERGTYILNSRDLCLVQNLPDLCNAGIQSLKIEGRMKSVHYLATVVRVYRQALDCLTNNPREFTTNLPEWLSEIEKSGSRGHTAGFFAGNLQADSQEYQTVRTVMDWDYGALIKEWDPVERMAVVEQRNHLQLGDEIELLRPQGGISRQKLDFMTDMDGQELVCAPHPQQWLRIRLDQPAGPFSMLRRRRRE